MNQTQSTPERKAKKSYTLSLRSLAFLDRIKTQRRAASISSILEEIVQAAQREHDRASLGRAVSDYYNSLSDEELTEQARWGEFALGELSDTERG
jgi:hypothetical protein